MSLHDTRAFLLLLAGMLIVAPAPAQPSRDVERDAERSVPREPAPRLSAQERVQLLAEAKRFHTQAENCSRRADFKTAIAHQRRCLALVEKLYPKQEYPGGHPDLAFNLNHLGVLLESAGDYAEARRLLERALLLREQLYPASKYPTGHPLLAVSLNNLGHLLETAKVDAAAHGYYEKARAMCEQLYPASKYPEGHHHLVVCLNNVGRGLKSAKKYPEARRYHEKALVMCATLFPASKYPEGHPLWADSLNNMGRLLTSAGDYAEARRYHEKAVAMCAKLYPTTRYPAGHPDLARSLNNLANVLGASGSFEEARRSFEKALAMRARLYPEQQYPEGHPSRVASLNNLGALLASSAHYVEARHYHEKALAMCEKLYPTTKYPAGHPLLAVCLNNLGLLLTSTGSDAEARRYHEKSLAMCEKLYPVAQYPAGHRDLVKSLNSLGLLLESAGNFVEARRYHEKALAMCKTLYPEPQYPAGHLDLANSLNNLGTLLASMGRPAEARRFYEQALAMRKKLYPESRYPAGHPYLANSLNNLGALLVTSGSPADAHRYFVMALAMRRKLYPEPQYPAGHPDLVRSLNNLGFILNETGRHAEARGYFEKALTMSNALVQRYGLAADEGETLDLLRRLPNSRDGCLSSSRDAPVPASQNYALFWRSRALVMRLLAQRRQRIRLALSDNAKVRQIWTDLLDTRRQLARLALSDSLTRTDRDRELVRLHQLKSDLERQLAALLPQRERDQDADTRGPIDLAARLAPRTAFLDVYYYRDFTTKEAVARYVAFVVRPDRSVRRVELGKADPLDDAVRAWRAAIAKDNDTSRQAAQIAERVWAPLARELPAGTQTVYLAPDGELARLPWCALPGRAAGTVLLEDLSLAVVPHGPFLLEQLRRPAHHVDAAEAVVALGDVDYGPASKAGYAALQGTVAELRQLTALADRRPVVRLVQQKATWSALQLELPRARYAHLATHGFYDAKALAAERQRLLDEWRRSRGDFTRGRAVRSPLAFVGLALAGANDPKGGGVVTGEALAGLSLDGLRLCVLSACESGLGDLGSVSGEPAQGLPRALHLAGCANVVSSLWNVNDRATAALMSRFYHELWVAKRPPLEALRQAQLTILRHPERITDLADRGRPDFAKTVRLPAAATTGAGRRAPTRLWAAFVLSGAGR